MEVKLFDTTPTNVAQKQNVKWFSAFVDEECKNCSPVSTPDTPYRLALPRALKEELEKKGINIADTEFEVKTTLKVNPNTNVKNFMITEIEPTKRSYGLKLRDDYASDYKTTQTTKVVQSFTINGQTIERVVGNRTECEDFITDCIVLISKQKLKDKDTMTIINQLELDVVEKFDAIDEAINGTTITTDSLDTLVTGTEEEEDYEEDDDDYFDDDDFFDDEEEEEEEEEEEDDDEEEEEEDEEEEEEE